MVLEIVKTISAIISAITGFIALSLMGIKPLRNKFLAGVRERDRLRQEANRAKETDKCLIRIEIVSIYYKYCANREIKQYAFENLALLYHQYKALGGNSFVDKVWKEAKGWRIIKN